MSAELAKGCYLEADRPKFEPATFWIASECSTITPHRPHKEYDKADFKVAFNIVHL